MVIKLICLLFIFHLFIFHLPTAQGKSNIAEGLEERQALQKERSILYGKLRAAGFKREVLDKCSLVKLRMLYAYVERKPLIPPAQGLGERLSRWSSRSSDILDDQPGRTERHLMQQALAERQAEMEATRILLELQRIESDRVAFTSALKAAEGKMLKTYIDLGGGDIAHINLLMKLD